MKRDMKNASIGGVCAGLARDIGVEPYLIRLAFVLAFLLFGVGPILYVVLWAIMGRDE